MQCFFSPQIDIFSGMTRTFFFKAVQAKRREIRKNTKGKKKRMDSYGLICSDFSKDEKKEKKKLKKRGF